MNYTSTVKEDPQTGDLYIEFPDEMMKHLGWKEGDVLVWEGNNETIYITRKAHAPSMDPPE